MSFDLSDAHRLLRKLLNPPSDGYQADYVEQDGRYLTIDAAYDLTSDEAELVAALTAPATEKDGAGE